MPTSPSTSDRTGGSSTRASQTSKSSSGSILTSCRPPSRSSTNTRSFSGRAGSPPIVPVTQRCGSTQDLGPIGSERLKEATVPTDRSHSASSKTASMTSAFPRSSPPVSGSSTPATTARPMPTTRTRARSLRPAPRPCGCCSSTANSRRRGCSLTGGKHSLGVASRPLIDFRRCSQNCFLGRRRPICRRSRPDQGAASSAGARSCEPPGPVSG